jgi:hypothetical protein
MNIPMGLWGSWIVLSSIWITYWVWHFASICRVINAVKLVCSDGFAKGANYIQIVGTTIGPPLVALAVVFSIWWVATGFLNDRNSN